MVCPPAVVALCLGEETPSVRADFGASDEASSELDFRRQVLCVGRFWSATIAAYCLDVDTALWESISRIRGWGEARDWRGYDPYDALNSPAAPILSAGTSLGRRLLTQAVKHSPVNVRPALGIRPDWNAMAVAAVAAGYARLWAVGGDLSARDAAVRWLDWLVAHRVGNSGSAWGYHFDVETRFFFYPRHSPNTIATSFVVQALVEGSVLLDERRWSEAIREAAAYLVSEMLIDEPKRCFFRYVPGSDRLIHNANLLAIASLVRANTVLDDNSLLEPAARALPITLSAQRDDGAWPYSETDGGWVDNFHTGYVLESLAVCRDVSEHVQLQLERGLDFWKRELFLPDATPKFLPNRATPFDAQCYAQAIETWLSMAVFRPDAVHRASLAAERLVADMLDPSGYVYFQRRRYWTNKTPFVRWSTAPAFCALARLALASSRSGGSLCLSGSI